MIQRTREEAGMRLAVGAILAIGLLAWPLTGRAAVVTCSPTQVSIISAVDTRSDRTLNTFANLPQAAITFIQGGSAASCVVVQFSAVAQGPDRVQIRAVLDEDVIATPPRIDFASTTTPGANSYTFVFARVKPGSHKVQMQYASLDGGVATVRDHVTVVHFAK